MFENMKPAQLNYAMKETRKDKKDTSRIVKRIAKNMRFNCRVHFYKHNGLEMYVTVWNLKQPIIELTTDYYPHTFSSDTEDIGHYKEVLSWANLQGCWNSDQKMYNFVTKNLINYDKATAGEFEKIKQKPLFDTKN